jgi:hypothetical protein
MMFLLIGCLSVFSSFRDAPRLEPQLKITKIVLFDNCPLHEDGVEKEAFSLYDFIWVYVEFDGLTAVRDEYGTMVNVTVDARLTDMYGKIVSGQEVTVFDYNGYIEELNPEAKAHLLKDGELKMIMIYFPAMIFQKNGIYAFHITITDRFTGQSVKDSITIIITDTKP